MSIRHFVLAGLLAATSAAQAVTVFSDNFNADVVGPNTPSFVNGWSITNGTVDVAGPGYFDLLPGHGNYVDLDGSTHDPALFSKSLSLTAGTAYTATFLLGGSQRNFTEVVEVSFGDTTATYTLAKADPFSLRTLSFTPTSSGTFSLKFSNNGSDNEGAFLDDVLVSSVPEPSTYALLLAGMICIGFAARRRVQR